jgi:hypothetical protein
MPSNITDGRVNAYGATTLFGWRDKKGQINKKILETIIIQILNKKELKIKNVLVLAASMPQSAPPLPPRAGLLVSSKSLMP